MTHEMHGCVYILHRWVQKKIEAYKDKEYIIKYVFLDDIKRIVLTRPGHDRNSFKPRVRVKTNRGAQVVLRNVGIDVFDQKVRKRDRLGKRDRKGGSGGKGKNSKDVITKQRPGKDGKTVIKTKNVDHGGKEAVNKEKAGKKGGKSGGKDGKSTPPQESSKKGSKKGNGNAKNGKKTDSATAEFLKSEAAESDSKTPNEAGTGDIDDGAGSGSGSSDGDEMEYNEEDWETLPDPEDALDEYMIEFMKELGVAVTAEDLGKLEEKLPEDDDDEDAAEDAKLDKEVCSMLFFCK